MPTKESKEVHTSPCTKHYKRMQNNNENSARAYCGGDIKNVRHETHQELKGTGTYFCTVVTHYECASSDPPTIPLEAGKQLISASHGIHHSKKAGDYFGNGEYKILMKDGGNKDEFWMHFRLTDLGGGRYRFDRLDCGDPDTILQKQGAVLKGGPITLTFAS